MCGKPHKIWRTDEGSSNYLNIFNRYWVLPRPLVAAVGRRPYNRFDGCARLWVQQVHGVVETRQCRPVGAGRDVVVAPGVHAIVHGASLVGQEGGHQKARQQGVRVPESR